jgi:hypothetical protein
VPEDVSAAEQPVGGWREAALRMKIRDAPGGYVEPEARRLCVCYLEK